MKHAQRCNIQGVRTQQYQKKKRQTHSNNSSAKADELFECVRSFCGVGA